MALSRHAVLELSPYHASPLALGFHRFPFTITPELTTMDDEVQNQTLLEGDPSKVIYIAISKFKGKTLPVDVAKIPDRIFELVIQEGLKALLNAKMSKLSTAKLEGDDLAKQQAAVLAQAEKNLEAIYDDTYTKGRPSSTTDATGEKIPAAVISEARRLARNDVKQAMKDANIKISLVPPKDVTAAANELIQKEPKYYTLAAENLAKRAATPLAIDIKSMVKVSPALVKKAEDEKAAKKAQLSAKQAGKVAPHKGSPSGHSDPNSPKVSGVIVPPRGQQVAGQQTAH